MTAAILEALAPIWGYIAAAIVAFGGFLAMQAKARREGRKQERQRQQLEKARAAAETQEDVTDAIDRSRASGASWHDRLRQHRAKR